MHSILLIKTASLHALMQGADEQQGYEADKELVLHAYVFMHPEPVQVQGILQPVKALLYHILCTGAGWGF